MEASREEPLLPRNEPLLPRSASFGSRNLSERLAAKTKSISISISEIMNGDVDNVKTLCILSNTSCLGIATLTVINPFSVLSPLHLLTGLYLLAFCALALALEV